jgi:hypothetical protein
VDGLSGLADPVSQLRIVCFDVGDDGIDLPQTVAACIDLHIDAAAVFELALGRGEGQGHRSRRLKEIDVAG